MSLGNNFIPIGCALGQMTYFKHLVPNLRDVSHDIEPNCMLQSQPQYEKHTQRIQNN
jgi:hypothetical protein